MPAIVLQNEKAEHVGFLLVAGKESLEKGAETRECVFIGVPLTPELEEDVLCDFVQTRRNEEFVAQIQTGADGLQVRVETPDDWTAVVHLPVGKWGAVHPTDGEVWGLCAPAPDPQ